jgi:hypothetical protein
MHATSANKNNILGYSHINIVTRAMSQAYWIMLASFTTLWHHNSDATQLAFADYKKDKETRGFDQGLKCLSCVWLPCPALYPRSSWDTLSPF